MGHKRDAKKAKRRIPTETLLDELRWTPEDWYPCLHGDKVRVRAIWNPDSGGGIACVWGADDFGMERLFDNRDTLLHIVSVLPKTILQEDLRKLGFAHA